MLKFNQLGKLIVSSIKNNSFKTQLNIIRTTNTVPDHVLEKARKSKLGQIVRGSSVNIDDELDNQKIDLNRSDNDYKFVYPDFLPNPIYYYRDKILERLERRDMIDRRKQFNIPEFYVGSILSVTSSDPYAPNKCNRFVGICTKREGYGLRHFFTLRNVIDGLGVEIMYELYNPTIHSIEVLKLEKRLDDDLTYLHDAPAEYSTIPFDMEPVRLPPNSKVPLNEIKVKLNPKPWRFKWDRKQLKGAILPPLSNSEYQMIKKSTVDHRPYERYDLMKHYRESINDDDYKNILKDIKQYEKDTEYRREKAVGSRKLKRARTVSQNQN